MPFARECSEWLEGIHSDFTDITAHCEEQEYGSYTAGQAADEGRCNDEDVQRLMGQFSPACCGAQRAALRLSQRPAGCLNTVLNLVVSRVPDVDIAGGNMEYCTGMQSGTNPIEAGIVPSLNSQPYCSTGCRVLVERAHTHAQCHPRFEAEGNEATIDQFLAVCQGVLAPGGGGGHRRLMANAGERLDHADSPSDLSERKSELISPVV